MVDQGVVERAENAFDFLEDPLIVGV